MGESTFFNRRSTLAFFLFVIAVGFAWWSPEWLTRPATSLVTSIAAPLQEASSWSAYEISDLVHFFGSLGALKETVSRFERENQTLRAENARLQSLSSENEELRALLDLRESESGTILIASVIGRAGAGKAATVTINRGSTQGVKVGNPIVAERGILAGKVVQVAPLTATAQLLPHPDTLVSATLSTTESGGIVRGDHGLGIVFDLAQKSETLKEGEAVVTSGLGDGFPRGLLIGTIERVQPTPDRLFQQAVVISPLTFERLRFVGVMLSKAYD